jgi:hemoglobin
MRTVLHWGWLAALACLPVAAPARAADDKPAADTKATDALIYTTLRDVINEGADMYNAKGRYENMERDFAGCYHFYEGALTVIRPQLAHRPNLQKAIDEGLDTARNTPQVFQRAFVLRGVIDKIRAETNPNPKEPPGGKALWDRLGGEAGVAKIVDDFTAAAAADKKLDLTRGGKYLKDEDAVKRVKKLLVELVSSVTGGPLKYTGRPMKEVHKGMAITDAEFDEAGVLLADALKKNGVKDDDAADLLAIIATTRKDIVEGAKPPPPPMTLWDRLGGEKGVTKVVDDLLPVLAKDEKVNFFRGQPPPAEEETKARKRTAVEFLSKVTGGPLKYTGKDMKEAHKGLGITNDEYDAMVKDLKEVLKKNAVPDDAAKELADLIEGMRKDIVEGKKEVLKPALWERIGGEKTAGKVVDDFWTAAVEDKEARFFPNPESRTKEKMNTVKADLLSYLSAVAKAPNAAAPKGLKETLGGQTFTDKEFDALLKDLGDALKKNGVAEADVKEITAAVGAARKEVTKPDDKPKGDAAVIQGKVTFNGKPLPGGVVAFEAEAKDGASATANIAEDGTYKVAGLAPGKYVVTVDTEVNKPAKPDDPKAGKYMPIPPAYRDVKTSPLRYEAGKGEQTYDIKLEGKEDKPKPDDKKTGDAGTVSGAVVYRGQPVVGAVVTFVPADGKPVTAKTNEEGTYKAEGLAPGAYKVAVSTEPADPKDDAKIGRPKFDKVPAKYTRPDTSPLAFDVKKGEQKYDIELTD